MSHSLPRHTTRAHAMLSRTFPSRSPCTFYKTPSNQACMDHLFLLSPSSFPPSRRGIWLGMVIVPKSSRRNRHLTSLLGVNFLLCLFGFVGRLSVLFLVLTSPRLVLLQQNRWLLHVLLGPLCLTPPSLLTWPKSTRTCRCPRHHSRPPPCLPSPPISILLISSRHIVFLDPMNLEG